MFHIDNKSGVTVMPPTKETLSETPLFFTEGGNGVPPSWPGADWFNIVQSELLNILKEADIEPDKTTNTQISAALKKMFLRVNYLENFGAKGDGVTDDTAALVAAHAALPDDSYISLIPGRNYKISGFTFTKRISLGCVDGRASITTATGLSWLTLNTDLNIDLRNFDLIPTLAPNQASPTWALQIEVTNKNFGSGGRARISDVNIKRPGGLAFYSGMRIKNQPVIIDSGDIVVRQSHTNAAAKDGSLANWAVNSGVGILLDSATYSVVRNARVYYATDGIKATGQIEEVHLIGCGTFNNRRNYVAEGLTGSSNEHRLWGCHGTTFLEGININPDGVTNVSLCSVDNCSILAATDATAPQIVYLSGWLDGANINSFQAFNNGTRGANDKAIWLRTVNGVGTRRVMIDGLQMKGVGTGVYYDTDQRNHISNVSALPANMVGVSPVIYAYGPNATSPVSVAFGFPDQENVLPAGVLAPRFMASGWFGLKRPNTVSGYGEEIFRVRELAGNFRFETADASGSLQYSAGIDQGGSLRTKAIYPLTTNAHTLGTSLLAWAGGFTQTALTVTSDERHKTQPLMLAPGSLGFSVSSDARMMESPHYDTILDAWSEVDFVQFKYLDRVEEKGDGARWHFGVIAQRAIEAFARYGIDAFAFGFACYDEWDDQEEVIEHHPATPDLYDAQGNLVQPAREAYSEIASPAITAGSKYGIRYEEALVLEAALQRRNYARLLEKQNTLVERISAIESR
ncbi:MAG: tail fiber domain-containing protein [Kluyvera intermedia]